MGGATGGITGAANGHRGYTTAGDGLAATDPFLHEILASSERTSIARYCITKPKVHSYTKCKTIVTFLS